MNGGLGRMVLPICRLCTWKKVVGVQVSTKLGGNDSLEKLGQHSQVGDRPV